MNAEAVLVGAVIETDRLAEEVAAMTVLDGMVLEAAWEVDASEVEAMVATDEERAEDDATTLLAATEVEAAAVLVVSTLVKTDEAGLEAVAVA